jgi:23S rRNA (guanosine2251-2'-O)-methyltransferase
VVLVLGHEGEGLTTGALGGCTHLARIPTTTSVDSLNVAMAAGVALYELSRASEAPP